MNGMNDKNTPLYYVFSRYIYYNHLLLYTVFKTFCDYSTEYYKRGHFLAFISFMLGGFLNV